MYTLYTVIPKWQPFLMENVLSLRVVHLVLALLIKAARATIWGGEGGRGGGKKVMLMVTFLPLSYQQ